MEALDFTDVAKLLNYSRTTFIDPEPSIGRENGWLVYEGRHKVHTSEYPFRIIYLRSGALRADLEAAARDIYGGEKVHVVYPPSLDQRHANIRAYFEKAAGVWTTKEYLASFFRDEIEIYLAKLRSEEPKFYIDPRVETPSGFTRKIPNPLLSLLTDRDPGSGILGGALGILLAEPGQGKTYMSKHLVSLLSRRKQGLVPIMVDSSQWDTLSLEDQTSLWKTIAHSFRHFGAPIGWLEGHEDEFLRATLKADLFRIVFDGFDEYILRNRGSVQPMEVLDALTSLARETGARIIITSRTSFWHTNLPEADVEQFVEQTGSFVYRILPFDTEHARRYFDQRLSATRPVEQAVQWYNTLRKQNEELVGRGFVLSLIADLVASEEGLQKLSGDQTNAVMWLMEALCAREVLRQQLPFSANEQIDFFRTFATEIAMGEDPSTTLLELAISDTRPALDTQSLQSAIEKLKSHPLIGIEIGSDRWYFKQEQVGTVLLADRLVRATPREIAELADNLSLDAGHRQDVGSMVVDFARATTAEDHGLEKLQQIISALSSIVPHNNAALTPSGSRGLSAVISLITIERFLPRGSSHQERTSLLLRVTGGTTMIQGLSFGGTIARYDFSGVTFEHCLFERVTWANCRFDGQTIFRRCHFVGGAPPTHCEGFGSVQTEECKLDAEAEAMFSSARVAEGKKRYSIEDLRNDFQSVLNKFLSKGGINVKSVDRRNLTKGSIGASRYRDEIIEVLSNTVLDEHIISGPAERGYHVRKDAVEALKFYATNNVFTGPLRDAFERLQRKLSLT